MYYYCFPFDSFFSFGFSLCLSDWQRGWLRVLLRRWTQHQGHCEQVTGSRGTGFGREFQLWREFAGICRFHWHGHHLEAWAEVTDSPVESFHPLRMKGLLLFNRPKTVCTFSLEQAVSSVKCNDTQVQSNGTPSCVGDRDVLEIFWVRGGLFVRVCTCV